VQLRQSAAPELLGVEPAARGLARRLLSIGDHRRGGVAMPGWTRNDERQYEKRTAGEGNPNVPLEQRTRDELYNLARELQIAGRGEMTKAELIEAIRRR
jgi:hypothetical protein